MDIHFLEQKIRRLGIDERTLARAKSRMVGTGLLRSLNQMGRLGDDQLVSVLQEETGLPVLNKDQLPSQLEPLEFSLGFLKAHELVPIVKSDASVDVAMTDPSNETARKAAAFVLGNRLGAFAIIRPTDWKRLISEGGQDELDLEHTGLSAQDAIYDQIADQDRDAPIARRIAIFLADAVQAGASDIHLEAKRDQIEIRFRIDGEMRPVAQEPASIADALIARIKVIADLDLGERRLPQDGRMTIVVEGRPIDVRVSIIPAAFGESAVLRLLDRPETLLSLERLGFNPEHVQTLENTMQAKDGLFLIAGPTGSGKTTTLYACLQLLAQAKSKIVSVEDPIEYQFDHVTQVQASDATGLTFSKVLRSFLRHDPDIICVGEIRDAETAKIAVQAALTGHLVIASIHAIDSKRIIARLIDMGIDEYQLDAALSQAIAQRLVRRLCQQCRIKRTITRRERNAFEMANLTALDAVWEADGCAHCSGSGYQGRLVVAEMIGETGASMMQDGLQKVAAGETSFDEVATALVGAD